MSPLTPISSYLDVIYLIYGLAFIVLALTVILRNNPRSVLKIARVFWLLATFALIHGLREWMELWRIVHGDSPAQAITRPLVLLTSYFFLFEFGRRLIRLSLSDEEQNLPKRLLSAWIYLPLAAIILSAVALGSDPLAALSLWSRFVGGFLGSLMAGLGLYLYARQRIDAEPETTRFPKLNRSWHYASAAFFLYAILGGLIAPRADNSLASIISEESFPSQFGIPIQLLRGACAIWIAIACAKILEIYNLENLKRMEHPIALGKFALTELYRIKPRYEAILEASLEGLIGLDSNGSIAFINEAALDILGYEREDVVGRTFHGLVHPLNSDETRCDSDQCLLGPNLTTTSVVFVEKDVFWRKNRTWLPVCYQIAPMLLRKQCSGVVIAFRDTSEQVPHRHLFRSPTTT